MLALAGLADCPKCKLLELQGHTFFTLYFPEGNDLTSALPFFFLSFFFFLIWITFKVFIAFFLFSFFLSFFFFFFF